jgi:hypothetical protein
MITGLVLACGDKGGTTDPTTDPSTTTAQTTTAETTAADTTDALTTTAGTTTTVETTTTTPGMTTTEAPTTEASSTGCAGDCGVAVENPSSLCDEDDPNMVPPSLIAYAGEAGKIDVTESGFETSCCLMLEPSVVVEGMTLNVSYTESGDPCDCICYYTITYTLAGLAPGTWTVVSGPQSVDVDVP